MITFFCSKETQQERNLQLMPDIEDEENKANRNVCCLQRTDFPKNPEFLFVSWNPALIKGANTMAAYGQWSMFYAFFLNYLHESGH